MLRRDADHRVDDIPRRDALAREDAVKVLRGDLTRPLSVPIRPSPLKVSFQVYFRDPLALRARVQRVQDQIEHVSLVHHAVRAPQSLAHEVCATLLDVLPDSFFLSHLLVIIVVRVADSVPALLAGHVEEEHMLAEFAHIVRKGLLVGRDRELVQVAFEEHVDLFFRPSCVSSCVHGIEVQSELGNIRSHDALKRGVVPVVIVLVLFGHVSSAVHVSESLRGLEQKIRHLGANVLRNFGPRLAALEPDRFLLLLLLLLGGLGIVPDLHLRGARDHGLGAQRVPQVVPSPRLPQPHDLGGRNESIIVPFPRLQPPHELGGRNAP